MVDAGAAQAVPPQGDPAAALDIPRVQAARSSALIGRAWHYAPVLGSTNNAARERAQAGAPEGLVVACEEQQGGRGRGAHRWVSPRGGLWFSFLLRPQDVPLSVLRYTALTAAGVAVAVEDRLGQKVAIHWPNDLMVGDRKLGGVLCEVATSQHALSYVVIGVGLNVNNPLHDFPADLRPKVTTLVELLGHPVDREELLLAILETVEGLIFDPAEGGFLRYRSRLSTLGQKVVIEADPPIEGLAIDIDESGQLLITGPEGLHTVSAGHCRHVGSAPGGVP